MLFRSGHFGSVPITRKNLVVVVLVLALIVVLVLALILVVLVLVLVLVAAVLAVLAVLRVVGAVVVLIVVHFLSSHPAVSRGTSARNRLPVSSQDHPLTALRTVAFTDSENRHFHSPWNCFSAVPCFRLQE